MKKYKNLKIDFGVKKIKFILIKGQVKNELQ